MPSHKTEIFFPFSPEKVFEMVKNIEEYPHFLPNCEYLTVKNTKKTPEITHILAEMGVKYSIFREKFTSNVQINDKNKTIIVKLDSGVLKSLSNEWQIIEHKNGSIAKFSIQIEMKNIPLRLALAAAFKIGVNDITEAFKQRANHLYSSY